MVNKDIHDSLAKKIEQLEKEKRWLMTLLEFAYERTGSCGCVRNGDIFNGAPEDVCVWFRKTGALLNHLEKDK